MKEYVANALHVKVESRQPDALASIPLYLKGQFTLEQWNIFGVVFLVAEPEGNPAVKTLEKSRDALEGRTGLPVAFAFGNATRYKVDRLLEAGVPFIVANWQIYLPFLGVVLSERESAASRDRAAEILSPQAQRFALKVAYGELTAANVSQAARLMDVTKMTASRIFDELDGVDSSWVTTEGRQRQFRLNMSRGDFWRRIAPYLTNPVVREHRLGYVPEGVFPLSGISALCAGSMLQDNPWPTIAVTRAGERELGLRPKDLDCEDEVACIVQVMRYELDSMSDHAIDPLSAILSLSDEEKHDPRIEAEVERAMKGAFGDERTRA